MNTLLLQQFIPQFSLSLGIHLERILENMYYVQQRNGSLFE